MLESHSLARNPSRPGNGDEVVQAVGVQISPVEIQRHGRSAFNASSRYKGRAVRTEQFQHESERRTVSAGRTKPNSETGVVTFPEISGDTPVFVMKTANVWEGDNLSLLQIELAHWPTVGWANKKNRK